ncbi:MAG: hypothetical protein ACRDHD_08675, partial [Candidatus Limnocylindria bacterium]
MTAPVLPSRTRGTPLSIRLATLLSLAVVAVLLVSGVAVNRFVSRSLVDEISNARLHQIEFLADQLEGTDLPETWIRGGGVQRALNRLARFVQGRATIIDDGQALYIAGQVPPNATTARIEEAILGEDGLTLVVEVPTANPPFLQIFNTTLVVAGVAAVVALMLAAALLS